MKPWAENPYYYRSLAGSLAGREARAARRRWTVAAIFAAGLIFITGAVCVALIYAGANR